VADVICKQCGHHNPEDANFCSSCGSALDGRADGGGDHTQGIPSVDVDAELDDDVAVDDDEVPEGAGMLVVKRGPGSGSRFVLEGEVATAGRHPDSDLFLDDVTVSRRHAQIVRTASGYLVRDAGSLNGTYLNRERIEEAALRNGDELQIGRFKLVFLSTSGSGGTTS